MVKSKATSVEEYLEELPSDRRQVIAKIRDLILENLPEGYRESMSRGMISYEIPLERYPDTYNGKPLGYIALAARKNHNALYLMSLYMDREREQWLKEQFKEAGLKPDMGKSCVRFKSMDDLPLEAISWLVADTPPDTFIEAYETGRKW